MPYLFLFILGIIIMIIGAVLQVIVNLAVPLTILASVFVATIIAYHLYASAYFNGQNFKELKDSIKDYVKNCNELNHHIQELKNTHEEIKAFNYGTSDLINTSNYNYKRKEWNKNTKSNYVHHCSASVCKNASAQPFKYLCKYFDVTPDEENLEKFENVLNNFAAAEQGKLLLWDERNTILKKIDKLIPSLIKKFSEKRLIKELGFEEIDLSDLYFPVYTFQYVSPGGNSSSKCDIKLDVDNLDNFVSYLNSLVKFRKSIAGQRALMTSSLREKIKERDDHTCKICGISANDEKHLLLEIDHILPLSKGGMSTEDNLQTLCWKCNRTKGSKLI